MSVFEGLPIPTNEIFNDRVRHPFVIKGLVPKQNRSRRFSLLQERVQPLWEGPVPLKRRFERGGHELEEEVLVGDRSIGEGFDKETIEEIRGDEARMR